MTTYYIIYTLGQLVINNYDLEICVDSPWCHYSSNRIKGPTWLIRPDMIKIG